VKDADANAQLDRTVRLDSVKQEDYDTVFYPGSQCLCDFDKRRPPQPLLQGKPPQRFPFVFSTGTDPVKIGLVESLSRPDGNLTGTSVFLGILWPKHVQRLHALLPAVNTIALLGNPDNVAWPPDVRPAD
jgi:ABC transporter substrate binding protein